MNVGFIGLGKLGLPCALAVESRGHKVVGYDPSEQVKDIIDTKKLQYQEIWAQDHLDKSKIEIKSIKEVVQESDIIFVPIQTPHGDEFEGITRIPKDRKDFDYGYLKQGIKDLELAIWDEQCKKVVIIISTVLPGTIRREIKPIIDKNPYFKLCYNPFFIAMGTVISDFTNPEFVLFGVDDENAAKVAEDFYKTIHEKPFYKTDVKSAELIKVAYNTFIGMKIVFANTMMEICYHTGANVDSVTDAMGLADDRLMTKKYLSGGMGDGGGCHPRDNIAMSWLANKLNLSHNFFDDLMRARENQTEWLAHLIEEKHKENTNLPIVLMGQTFKPETNLVVGSPAILLGNILKEKGINFTFHDPYVGNLNNEVLDEKSIYLISTKHDVFENLIFPNESIIIDPHRFINKSINPNSEVIYLG